MRPTVARRMLPRLRRRPGLERWGYRAMMYSLIAATMVLGIYLSYRQGVDLPTAAGMYALVVVLSAALAGLRFAGGLALAASLALTILGLLQSQRLVAADTDWLTDGIQVADIMGFLAIFGVLVLAGWAASREVKRSSARVRALHQPAEVGRLATHLLHDLANPIAVATLNLEQLDGHQRPLALNQAIASIRCLERYVVAARKQVQQRSQPELFKASTEVSSVVELLAHKARWQGVSLEMQGCQTAWVYGDPVKFNQLILNLVANAIEAYAEAPTGPARRTVDIKIRQASDQVVVTVTDNGGGIADSDRAKLFVPFYTTKRAGGRGSGLGLAIARQIACDEFGGRIEVASTAATTCFTVTLPAARAM